MSVWRGQQFHRGFFRVRDGHFCAWKTEDSKVVSMRMTAVCMVLKMVAIGDNAIGRQVILPG